MTNSNTLSLDLTGAFGSIIETTAMLDQLLRPEGYARDTIADIATSIFVDNERSRIHEDASMHLIAIKKTLLYAIPIIAPPNSSSGIAITSQVATPAIQLNKDRIIHAGLAQGDKFRLLGFAFPETLVNHLAMSIFPQKYFEQPPDRLKLSQLRLDKLDGLTVKPTNKGTLYLIDKAHYEDLDMFNEINKVLATKLRESITTILATLPQVPYKKFDELRRVDPYNNKDFIGRLNQILERKIDTTFSLSMYEVLHMTMNQMLYDYIALMGFSAKEISERLDYLAYVKEQNSIVRAHARETMQQRLLATRAEKLCREKYPFFFDFTDKRAIFIHFNRFDINKLPKKEKAEIEIMLQKDLDAQAALLVNKCEHLKFIKQMESQPSLEAYKKIEQYIDIDSLDADGMYACKLCKYPLMCSHTVDLYDALSSVDDTEDSDHMYWTRQKIINKYKLINQKKTGLEDTETIFTYYCKFCGGELGKSDDIIQASVKAQEESTVFMDRSPAEKLIYMNIISTITRYMNPNVISVNPKILTGTIADISKEEILSMTNKSSFKEDEQVDLLIRYLTHVYTLVSLISININKIKSPKSVFIDETGSSALKDELMVAFKLVRAVSTYKNIGITDEKIKTILIQAFKFVNRDLSNEAITLKTISPADLLAMDIDNSPIIRYARFMYHRFEKKWRDPMEVSGVVMDKLYPKKKNEKPVDTHALYTNIYEPTSKPNNDTERFIIESYRSISEFSKTEPIKNGYVSSITPPLDPFVLDYQAKLSDIIRLRRTTPIRYLPVENSREYNFRVKALHLVYCLTGEVRAHRWVVSKTAGKHIFTCKYCGITIDKVSISNNDKIEDRLLDQRIREAFFELYTISCPVKDAHVFEDGECVKCGATKKKISDMDEGYYKKYSKAFLEYHQKMTDDILSAIKKITSNTHDKIERVSKPTKNVKVDTLKIESAASELNKMAGIQSLDKLGMSRSEHRSMDDIKSYVRMLYTHYIFAKNMCMNVASHYDTEYYKLVRSLFIKGKTKKLDLPNLPEYPTSDNADQLLLELLTILLDTWKNDGAHTHAILKYIMGKMVMQDERYKEFNFAKLKATPVSNDMGLDSIADSIEEITDDTEMDMFDGYDMDGDDMEDNINGYTD